MVPHLWHASLTLVVVMPGLHAFTPSDHLLSSPPQFLNQAPPGAQQLTLPDLRKVPQLGQVIERSKFEAKVEVLIGVLTMSSRSGFGRRNTSWRGACVVTGVG